MCHIMTAGTGEPCRRFGEKMDGGKRITAFHSLRNSV